MLLHCSFAYPASTTKMSLSSTLSYYTSSSLSCPPGNFGEGRFGEFGNWPWHLREVRGCRRSSQRRLSDGEHSALAHMSAVSGDRPAWQQHAGSPLPLTGEGGADPGRIVTVGSSGNRFVRPFLLFPPLTHNNPLEAYDMLVK